MEKTVSDQQPAPEEGLLSSGKSGWIVVFALLILAVITILIAYGGYLERRAFVQTQTLIADNAVTSAGNQIAMLLSVQRQTLKQFVELNVEELNELAAVGTSNPLSIRNLFHSLQNELPELSSLALVNMDKDQIWAETPGLITDELKNQLRLFFRDGAGMHTHVPGEDGHSYYHLIIDVSRQQDTVLIAFMDYRPLSEMLARTRSADHFLMLLGSDSEVTPFFISGDEQVFSAGHIHSQRAAGTLAAMNIPGTGWQLIDIPDSQLYRTNLFQIVLQRLLILGLALLIIAIIFIMLIRRQRALQDSRDELLTANKQLRYASMHDALTGLPNRVLLEERIRAKINECNRFGSRFLLMLVSLNEFQRINKNLGYDVGDKVLQQIANRLSDMLREMDSVARFEGDVFAVLADIKEKPQASIIARKILECLDQPIDVADSPLAVSASMGVAVFPDQGRDPGALIRNASGAVNLAKSSGGKIVVFSAEGEGNGLDRLSLITDIGEAMNSGELSMVYQPKLSLTAPDKQSFEALLRWKHADYGPLPCDMFIPLIEQTKHIVDLTHWTIENCFRTLHKLQQVNSAPSVAVNLSARVLDEDGFPEWVERMLGQYNLDPSCVRFELTESAMMDDSERAMQVMLRLAALGIGLSVDDFGVGHSSLAYISRLPVDELKVDKGFVLNMQKWENDRAIVKATIDLAHDLGLSVVAEGVETLEQATMLREMECDSLQGYYVSRPLSEEQMFGWLTPKAS